MRIVLVCPYLPHRRINHGGGVATYHFARHLARRHDLTVLCFQRSDEADAVGDLVEAGARVETIPFHSDHDQGFDRVGLILDRGQVALRAWLGGTPMHMIKNDRPAMHQRLRDLLGEGGVEAVIVEYTFMAQYCRTARDEFARLGHGHVVLNTHEAGTLARLRRAIDASGWIEQRQRTKILMQWARREISGLSYADTATCVTSQDLEFFSSLTSRANLRLMPLGISADSCPPVDYSFASPPRILFVGSFHHLPNRDALASLLDTILPAVRQQHPDAVLDVVGSNLPADLARQATALGNAVEVHGFVEDLEPLYRRSSLFVAPLFSGGGIKIKILEAAARGCPVLTTPIGLEGIDLAADRDLWVATDEPSFAAQASALLHRPDDLRAVGSHGRASVLARYEWSSIVAELSTYLESVV